MPSSRTSPSPAPAEPGPAPSPASEPPVAVLGWQETWNALPPLDRRLVELLSFFYLPVRVDLLRTALEAFRAEHAKRFSKAPPVSHELPAIEAALANLEQAGMVSRESGMVGCHICWVEIASRRALIDSHAHPMARIVRTTLREKPAETPPAPPKKARTPKAKRSRADHQTQGELMRDLRLALFEGRFDEFWCALPVYAHRFPWETPDQAPLWQICCHPFEAEWLNRLPPPLAHALAPHLASAAVDVLERVTPLLAWLRQLLPSMSSFQRESVQLALVYRYLVEGDFEAATAVAADLPREQRRSFEAVTSLLRGDHEIAVRLFEEGDEMGLAGVRGRATRLDNLLGAFYMVALLHHGAAEHLHRAEHLATAILAGESRYATPFLLLRDAVRQCRGVGGDVPLAGYAPIVAVRAVPLQELFVAYVLLWSAPQALATRAGHLGTMLEMAEKSGCRWLASEIAEIVSRVTDAPHAREKARMLRQELASVSLADAIKPAEPWERLVASLAEIADMADTPDKGKHDHSTRLAWMLTWSESGEVTGMNAREQVLDGAGNWSHGRPVTLKRLLEHSQAMTFLADQDRRICTLIECVRPELDVLRYELPIDLALPMLVGHPLVFREDDPEVRVDVVMSRPELRLEKGEGGLCLTIEPQPPEGRNLQVICEGSARLRVVLFQPDDRRLAEILGRGASLPERATVPLMRVLSRLADRMPVRSDYKRVSGESANDEA